MSIKEAVLLEPFRLSGPGVVPEGEFVRPRFMERFARSLSARGIRIVSVSFYVLMLCMAVLPPLYLAVSGQRGPVLFGLPLVVAYFIANAAMLGIGLAILYRIEDLRGGLDEVRFEGAETS